MNIRSSCFFLALMAGLIVADITVGGDKVEDRIPNAEGGDGGVASGGGCLNAPGSCFAPHDWPGCEDDFCCNAVCAQDSFCCNTEWDAFCVSAANSICATCGGAGAGPCSHVHQHVACNDLECCGLVCASDPFCCNTQWDQFCANAAGNMCGCGAPFAGSCFTVHDSAWCNDQQCCDRVCNDDPFCCDTAWDSGCVTLAGYYCTCGGGYAESCFKSHLSPWCDRGECCSEVCAGDSYCCDVSWDSLCVLTAYIVCCPADIAPYYGDGVVNVNDLLTIINSWGPCSPFFTCQSDMAPPPGNGQVNVDDLLYVINQWGPCD